MADSWKVRCTDDRGYNNFTIGKIYELNDGIIICDDGEPLSENPFVSIDAFIEESIEEWELITDKTEI